MKQTNEYKFSIIIFCVAITLLCAAGITGIMLDINPVIEKVCFYLGNSFNGLGLVFLLKAKKAENDKH